MKMKYISFSNTITVITSVLLILLMLNTVSLYSQGCIKYIDDPVMAINSNSPVKVGANLKLFAFGGSSYAWSGPNGFASTMKEPSFTVTSVNSAGTYYCTITDTISNTSQELCLEVEIYDGTRSNIVCDDFICEYSDLLLTSNTGGPGATWSWFDNYFGVPLFIGNGQTITYLSIQGIVGAGVYHTIQCTTVFNGNTTIETKDVFVLDCCHRYPVKLLNNINISSDPPPYNYPAVVIRGVVEIDQNTNFAPITDIVMLPDATLNVQNNQTLTIHNSNIGGCGGLWWSIRANNGSTLDFDNNSIMSGIWTIYTEAVSPIIKLSNNTFINNHNAVSIVNTSTADLSTFTGNDFFSSGILTGNIPPFSGLQLYNALASLPSPLSMNRFHYLMSGIYSSYSTLDIPAPFARFYNFNSDFAQFGVSGVGIYVSDGVFFHKEGTNSVAPYDFESCNYGIKLTNCPAIIDNNSMDDMIYGIQINLNVHLKTEILKNSINTRRFGIDLEYNDPVAEMMVFDNTINLDYGLKGLSACINISEGSANQFGAENISTNHLFVNQGKYGIYGVGANNIKIDENHINLYESDYNQAGISLRVCQNLEVKEDTVIGSGALDGNLTDLVPVGLQVILTTSSLYQCNYFSDIVAGTTFGGGCGSTDFITNHFNNHHIGLYYDPNAVTGPQRYNNNWWTGSYLGPLAYKARHDGLPNIVAQSPYYVWSSPPVLNPVPGNMTIPDPGWFFVNPNAIQFNGCGGDPHFAQLLQSEQVTQLDSIVADTGLPYADYTTQMQWQDGRTLLSKLSSNDSLLISNNAMQVFVDSVQNESVGLFQNVQSLKSAVYYLTPVTESYLNTLNVNINITVDSIHEIDSLLSLALNSLDSLQLVTAKSSLILTLQNLSSQLISATKGYQAIATNAANLVIDDNGILPANEIFENNEKVFNDIYLNTVAKGKLSFTPTQQSDLLNIASQCSLLGGKAVFYARAMYSLISDSTFNDRDICLQNGVEKHAQTTNSTTNEHNFRFYPNPAHDQITLLWENSEDADCSLTLMNVLGKVLGTNHFSLLQNSYQVDLTNFASGVYLIQIINHSKKTNLGKIVITR